jgi:hypothetical protein
MTDTTDRAEESNPQGGAPAPAGRVAPTGLPADSAFVAEATSAKEAALAKAGASNVPPQNIPAGASPTPPAPIPAPVSPAMPVTPPPLPATPPVSPSAPTPAAPAGAVGLKGDIAKILSEVKLPERRNPNPAAPPQAHEIPTALGATVVPATPVAPPAPPAEAPAGAGIPGTAKESIVSPVHTLKDDLKEVVSEKKISVVRAVSLEEERRHKKTDVIAEVPQKPRATNRLAAFLFTILVLFGLGGAALWGVYTVMQERLGENPTTLPTSSILFAENAVLLPLHNQSPLDLKRIIAGARQTNTATLGAITRIIPVVSGTDAEGAVVDREATLKEFLDALGARPPEELFRALKTEFFFGLHTLDLNTPILIIPVTSYDRAFAGMLTWEATINGDFAPAFTYLPDQVFTPEGLPEKRRFVDLVMRNYDVRALRDDAGSIRLYYSFPTQRVLVIAESPHSFVEILSRLQAQRSL